MTHSGYKDIDVMQLVNTFADSCMFGQYQQRYTFPAKKEMHKVIVSMGKMLITKLVKVKDSLLKVTLEAHPIQN